MSCKLADSCQLIINSKDEKIQEKDEKIEELENEMDDFKMREKIFRGLLLVQGVLLVIGFQFFDT